MLSRARARLLRRSSTRKGREAEGVVLIEGPRAVETALEHGAVISFALVEKGLASLEVSAVAAGLARGGVDVVELPVGGLAEFAGTETPQGVLAVAREPRADLPDPSDAAELKCLLLDRVQDPGNVGTLIRSAAALGVDRVVALDGTADPWNAKAVRASAGLVFRVPVHSLPWDTAAAWVGDAGLPLLVADTAGEDPRAWLAARLPEEKGWALLVGNEGSGPRPEAVAAARMRLVIPVTSGVESLNVSAAGAILLWILGPGTDPGGERS